MGLDSLSKLKQHSPELFETRRVPQTWEDDLIVIPIDNPDGLRPDAITSSEPEGPDQGVSPPALPPDGFGISSPDGGWSFPGGLTMWPPHIPNPPADALAFYLPFHYFLPKWWGIYIIAEGALWLATQIEVWSKGQLTWQQSMLAARVFLYGHELYHHGVEMLSTRLEVTHRIPLYKNGFEAVFRRGAGTDSWTEEALANGQGLRKVKSAFARVPPAAREALMDGFLKLVKNGPKGYRRGGDLVRTGAFKRGEAAFIEENQRACFPGLPPKDQDVWGSFPYAVAGMSRRTSRANYVIKRGSHLAMRLRLDLRYLRYRDVAERLRKLAGCEPVRPGAGSHERWKNRLGYRFTVPRHPGDLSPDTVRKIIQQAGLKMGLEEFAAAEV